MSLIKRFSESYQTYTSFLTFDMYNLLHEIRYNIFPEINESVDICFVIQDTLACIFPAKGVIFLHNIFNHPQTPLEVIRYVFIHELIHIIVPPEEINNKMVSHPPLFWQVEKERSLERTDVWRWIYLSFFQHIKKDKNKECIFVKPSWKKYMKEDRLSVEYFKKVFSPVPENTGI